MRDSEEEAMNYDRNTGELLPGDTDECSRLRALLRRAEKEAERLRAMLREVEVVKVGGAEIEVERREGE